MQRRVKLASCLFLGISVAGLLYQPAFARQKTSRSGDEKFASGSSSAVAPKPTTQLEVGKVILVLETRDHQVTVRSGEEGLRYSVATLQGIALADGLSVMELKDRFPDLHEIATGIAWAGR